MLTNAALACDKHVVFKEGVCKGGKFLGCFHGDLLGGSSGGLPWRPDADDGDCARLEAQLRIAIEWGTEEVYASAPGSKLTPSVPYKDFEDKQAARRYAVLMLASAIGSALEDANLDS